MFRYLQPNRHFSILVQSQQLKHQKNCSGASIFEFEQVNAEWELTLM